MHWHTHKYQSNQSLLQWKGHDECETTTACVWHRYDRMNSNVTIRVKGYDSDDPKWSVLVKYLISTLQKQQVALQTNRPKWTHNMVKAYLQTNNSGHWVLWISQRDCAKVMVKNQAGIIHYVHAYCTRTVHVTGWSLYCLYSITVFLFFCF